MDVPRLWRVAEVARILNCATISVYRALEAGTMPGYKLASIGWRVDPEELNTWRGSQRNTTGARDRGGSRPPRLSSRSRGAGLTGETERGQT